MASVLVCGLLLGGGLFLMGFAGCAWITWQWAASGFGELHEVRQVLFWERGGSSLRTIIACSGF